MLFRISYYDAFKFKRPAHETLPASSLNLLTSEPLDDFSKSPMTPQTELIKGGRHPGRDFTCLSTIC